MHKDNETNELIAKMSIMLESIEAAFIKKHDDFVGLYENELMFGKIKDDQLYLLNDLNQFSKVDTEILESMFTYDLKKLRAQKG